MRFSVRNTGFLRLLYFHKGKMYRYEGKLLLDSVKEYLENGTPPKRYGKRIPKPPSTLKQAWNSSVGGGSGKGTVLGIALVLSGITIVLLMVVLSKDVGEKTKQKQKKDS
eukprot:CAMPEP_0194056594 /NCGR_PEP_ID=MMETSP0009_2-20130614/60649_1 /TAXON_ID=210454 /ORGANISM="Grammatophora oceanica, Strain CCMP 410" /LENGTH=109 /DNA_ID=CAMNT_0038706023 /DNA_START=395 /DNA_END=724 /DNA_ORIENTATION=-